MKIRNISVVLLCLFFLSTSLRSQDENNHVHDVKIGLPEVALLDVESKKSLAIVLAAKAPEEAGLPLDFSDNENSDLWINYTSIIGSKSEPSRAVTVQITSGEVPAGLELSVEAKKAKGSGKGNFGIPVGKVKLSPNAKKIISGVGSCFTGDGPNNGHQLTYSLQIKNLGQFGKLDFDQAKQAMSVTFTLTDN